MRKNQDQKPVKHSNARFASCHACLSLTNEYAKCSLIRCKNYYCFSCIYDQFDKNFLPENYFKAKDCWVCYSCGGNCKCRFCIGIDRNRKKRKPKLQNDSPSVKSVQKKDNEQNPSQQQDPIEINQNQSSSKKKIIYSNRRLPVKKNNAFKYRTKKRGKSKSSVDVKSLLENIKPVNKIFKIKRDQYQESSQSQSQKNSEGTQKQMNSEQQDVSVSISEQKYDKQRPKSSEKQNQKIGQIDTKKKDNKIDSIQKDNNSSSLDYLGQKDNKDEQSQSDQNKTKPIRKSTRISKLPTIKSIKSQKQNLLSNSSIKNQGHQNQQQKSQSQSQSQNANESGYQQSKKKNLYRSRSQRGGVSRSRTRTGKRRSQFKLKKQDISDSEKESEEAQKQQPRRGVRRQRQSYPQFQIKQIKSTNRKPISSRQAKQLRDLMQNSTNIPKRRSQRNETDFEQKNENKLQQFLKQEQSQQDVYVKPQSQFGKQKQSLSESQQKGLLKNKIRQVRNSKLKDQMEQDQIQDEEDDESQNTQKPKRNNLVKKHYLEELEKNKQFQVDSSDSEPSKPNQENNQQPKSQNIYEPQNPSDQPLNSIQPQIANPEKTSNSINEKAQTQQQKSNLVQSPQKSYVKVSVFRKPIHHKKNLPQGSQVAHRGVQKNVIVNKWKTIQDHQLLDIKNIQKLGMLALFARQNLSKEMNELIKRRNLLMQKIKLQDQAQNQALNAASN